jgi:hypothetical protein
MKVFKKVLPFILYIAGSLSFLVNANSVGSLFFLMGSVLSIYFIEIDEKNNER